MFRIIPYEEKAIENFQYNGIEQSISGQLVVPIINFYANLGSCYIAIVNHRILGVGGVYPLWEGAGGCFLFLNREAAEFKKNIYKSILEYMAMLMKQYNIKTMIVECQKENEQANTLIEHLGFVQNKQIIMTVYTKEV